MDTFLSKKIKILSFITMIMVLFIHGEKTVIAEINYHSLQKAY